MGNISQSNRKRAVRDHAAYWDYEDRVRQSQVQNKKEFMGIDELKKELGFDTKGELNAYMAELFALKTVGAFENSSARERYENAVCSFYAFVKSKERGENK